MSHNPRPPGYGLWLLATGALLALALSIFNYFWSGNGIHGSAGALLVIVSSALMLGAAIFLHVAPLIAGWLGATLLTLIALDIAGTALAAYMLEAYGLLAVMAVALIGWVVHLIHDFAPRTAGATQ
jgi:hypothetical protein